MEQLAVIMELLNLADRMVPILESLGPSRVSVYCHESYLKHNRQLMDMIESKGFKVLAANDGDRDFTVASHHRVFLTEAGYWEEPIPENHQSLSPRHRQIYEAQRLVNGLDKKGKLLLGYTYSLEQRPSDLSLRSGRFFMSPFEEMFFQCIGPGTILCNRDGEPEMGWSANGAELATIGQAHVLKKHQALGQLDKKDLQKELQLRLGVSFKPGQPLALYWTTRGNETAAVDRGLPRLAERINLLVKTLPPDNMGTASGFNTAYCRLDHPGIFTSDDFDLNWLLRYAADVNLLDPWSGGFYTTLMLGIRSIIAHSTRFLEVEPPYPVNYTYFLGDSHCLWAKVTRCLAPINIEATEMLLDRIQDQDYWLEYDRNINRIATGVLGRYWLGEEAADRAAVFIKRLLDQGTFAPGLPEEPTENGFINGPVTNGYPLDIVL